MRPKDLAALVVLAALWGGSYLFIRLAAPAFGPLPLAAGRASLAALVLWVGMRVLCQRPVLRANARKLLILGAANAAVPFSLIAAAELHLTASFAAMLTATTPLWGALFGAVWLGERVTALRGAGLLLGLVGVGVLVGWSPIAMTGPTLLSVGAMLLATCGYGLAGVYAKRHARRPGLHPRQRGAGERGAVGQPAAAAPPRAFRRDVRDAVTGGRPQPQFLPPRRLHVERVAAARAACGGAPTARAGARRCRPRRSAMTGHGPGRARTGLHRARVGGQDSQEGFMRWLRLAVLFGVVAAGCSRPSRPGRVCTRIGCESGLEIQLDRTPAGAFRVEARAPGDAAPRVFECPAAGQCGGRVFFRDFTPDSATIRVIVGADTIVRSVRPAYEIVQPNGPGCPPTCRQGRVRIDLEVVARAQVDTPPPSGQPDPGSPEAAVAVIRDYYAAIARGDFARAYAHWAGDGAASGRSFDEFRHGYAGTAGVEVEVGEPGRIEPAAGSRFIQVPVETRATRTDGSVQCFRGTYTLRRSVVTGASAEERRWRIHSADVEPCDRREEIAARSAASVVERFGARLARVSLLAPIERLRQQIRAEYGPLVTPSLLASWLGDPSAAPGRAVSSPWPDRIEARHTRRIRAGVYEVVGDVVYVTSAEIGRGGAAYRDRVVLTVVRGEDGRWRIADYEER